MPDPVGLGATIQAERADAVRLLLRTPLVTRESDPDGFVTIARHGPWIREHFEAACGWPFVLDVAGGFARLSKRSSSPDAGRPARSSRGEKRPFDRRRYELLCLACAELDAHPVTTIGILAANLAAGQGRLDTARLRERRALVEALRLLREWGVVRFEGGDIDTFVASEEANALIVTDAPRLHHLLSSPVPPSRLEAATTAEAVTALAHEPRYQQAVDGVRDDEQHRLGVRHRVLRRILDDPAVYDDDLADDELAWVRSPAGRRWMRDRVTDSGFVLEERAEGVVAVDPTGTATDIAFPAPHGNVHQAALLLVDLLVEGATGFGPRRLATRTRAEIDHHVQRLLARHPAWAREYQAEGGAHLLASAAVHLLAELHLVRVDEVTGDVEPRPAIARYVPKPPDDGGLFSVAEQEH